MVKKCCVVGCRSESYRNCGITFFKLPKSEPQRQQWIDAVPGKLMNYSVVCHVHFRQEDILAESSRPKLSSNAVPSIFHTDSMEELDEGQEEWLSEGILTDDDFHPAADNDSSAIQSQDEAMEQEDSTDIFTNLKNENQKPNDTELNTDKIEEALDNMEKTDENEDDLPGDLGTFLVRKSDGKIIETRDDSEMDSVRQSDEDANDTDELLRMLGDDDQKVKKKEVRIKVDQKKSNDQHSTDEEDAFERLKMTRLQTKKGVLKKAPTKAVPEVTTDEETSTKVTSRTKPPKKATLKKVVTKVTSEDMSEEEHPAVKVTRRRAAKQAIAKKTPAIAVPEDLTDDDNVSSDDRSTVKKMFNVKRKVHFASKSTAKSSITTKLKKTWSESESSKPKAKPPQKAQKPKPVQMKAEEPEELINEEEFLEDDAFEMDEFGEDLELDGEGKDKRQPIMRPERMDEEFPSDGDSGSDENSLYDELPSTDTEDDMEDWFTLDIRSERAGDYLPLLGNKAHEVLLDEKKRISGRVASLRENLSAIADGSKAQAEQLRRASLVIAELDAAIKAA